MEEETLKNEIIEMCLLLEKELKMLKREWRVKKMTNVQFKQQCRELKRQIAALREKADEPNNWDVIEMQECEVKVKLLEENQLNQEKLIVKSAQDDKSTRKVIDLTHSINNRSQTKPQSTMYFDGKNLVKTSKNLVNNQHLNYQCQHPGCRKSSKSKPYLEKHQNIHSLKYQCQVCRMCFISENCLKVHSQIHNSGRQFACAGCEERFTKNEDLKQHFRSVHFKQTDLTNLIIIQSSQTDQLNDQVPQQKLITLTHSNDEISQIHKTIEKPIESSSSINSQPQMVWVHFEGGKLVKSNPKSIQLFNKTFLKTDNNDDPTPTELTHLINVETTEEDKSSNKVGRDIYQRIHLNEYHREDNFQSSPSDLHQPIDTGEKQYVCDWNGCGKRFRQKATLKQHARFVHLKERPFQCNENGCGKSFQNKFLMKQHLQFSHSFDRLFPCQVEGCDWQAKTKYHLARHVKYSHSDVEFRCDFENCQKTYKCRYYLLRHQQKHHQKSRC